MQTQYTNTAKEREKKKRLNINTRQRQCGYLALLFCLCALTLAPAAVSMSGRVKYCRSREGWVYTTPVSWCVCALVWLSALYTTRVSVYSLINNGFARLPASAHFPTMKVASVVRRPGGCCPSRRSSSAGETLSRSFLGLMAEVWRKGLFLPFS